MKPGLVIVCVSTIVISLLLAGEADAGVNLDDAVGIWLFDEGEGDVVIDSSGKGNDGEILGAEWVDDGKFGSALKFDGAASYVNCGNDESFNITDNITVMAWAKMEVPSGTQAIIAKDIGWETNSWQIFASHTANSNKPRSFVIVEDGGRGVAVAANASTDTRDDGWHHYALTYSTSDGVVKYYVDGVEEGSAEDAEKRQIQVTDTDVNIGRKSNAANFFSGLIDEVAILNVALTEDDIKAIMTQGILEASAVEYAGKLTTRWAAVKIQY